MKTREQKVIDKLTKKANKMNIKSSKDFIKFKKLTRKIAVMSYNGSELYDCDRLELINSLEYRYREVNNKIKELLNPDILDKKILKRSLVISAIFEETYIIHLMLECDFGLNKVEELLSYYSYLSSGLYTDGDFYSELSEIRFDNKVRYNELILCKR